MHPKSKHTCDKASQERRDRPNVTIDGERNPEPQNAYDRRAATYDQQERRDPLPQQISSRCAHFVGT
jgi:hypothetical protein